jgi:predicted small metal-binding protein
MQKIEDHARSVHSMELHSDEAALQKVRQAIKNA